MYHSGLRIVEYTNRGSNALVNFKVLKAIVTKEMPDLLLGIGTIKTAQTAQEFIALGADFIVSPVVSTTVAKVVIEHDIVWIPGCLTPTEIDLAQSFGASLIKIFPGNLVGPSYIETIKDIFPDLLFMPTGGVTPEKQNLKEWFDAGVCAVGMGSKLLDPQLIENGDFDALTTTIKKISLLIQSCKLT